MISIIEFYGLPGAGKSTTIDSIESYLNQSKTHFQVIRGLPFVDITSLRLFDVKKVILAAFLVFKYLYMKPVAAFHIIKSCNNPSNRKIFDFKQLLTLLQYHLSHMIKFEELLRMSDSGISNQIFICDGSPLNLLVEPLRHTKYIQDEIYNYYCQLCSCRVTTVCCEISPSDSLRRMHGRHQRQLEISLYGRLSTLSEMSDNIQKIQDNFRGLINCNHNMISLSPGRVHDFGELDIKRLIREE